MAVFQSPEENQKEVHSFVWAIFRCLVLLGGMFSLIGETTAAASPEVIQRLATLKQGFIGAFQRDFGITPEAAFDDLKEKYLNGLQKMQQQAQSTGKAHEVNALKEETERIKRGEPLPEADEQDLPESLSKLRQLFRTESGKRNVLYQRYEDALTAYGAELKNAGKMDDANAVEAERQKVMQDGAAFNVDTTIEKTPRPTSSSPAPEVQVATQNGVQIPKADEKAAAMMVLEKGGTVSIPNGIYRREIKKATDLPKGFLQIEEVRFNPEAGTTVELSDEDMRLLCGLKSLECLFLDGTTVIDAHLAYLQALPKLKRLSLKKCQQITDNGMSHISLLKELIELSIQATNITSAGISQLATLGKLELFDLGYMSTIDKGALPMLLKMRKLVKMELHGSEKVDKEFLEGLAGLPGLSSLLVSSVQLAPPVELNKLKLLTELFVYGEAANPTVTDATVTSIISQKGLEVIRLKYLNILDQQLAEIASLPRLEQMEVENVRPPASGFQLLKNSKIKSITVGKKDTYFDDEMLLSLIPIKSMKTLILSSKSKITDAGLAQFRKARSEVTVEVE